MPDYDKLLQASLPEALDAAVESINFVYYNADQLLQANLEDLEDLNYCVFTYFNRDDVFYLNSAGRRLLDTYESPAEPSTRDASLVFHLENYSKRASDDRDVIESCRPKHHLKELISLSWGKTWLRGSKYPVRSNSGVPLAILFAGREMLGSEQIYRAAIQCRNNQHQFGAN